MSQWFSKRDFKAAMAFAIAAVSLIPISLAVLFLPPAFQRAPLDGLGTEIFFLPQRAFPFDLRGPRSPVPSWLTLAAWAILTALFALGTRRLPFRWIVVIALPVVVLCVYACTTILGTFGYSVILDGP